MGKKFENDRQPLIWPKNPNRPNKIYDYNWLIFDTFHTEISFFGVVGVRCAQNNNSTSFYY